MTNIETETVERPKFAALHHISLPCRDVKEAISFYYELLGGDLIHEQWGFFFWLAWAAPILVFPRKGHLGPNLKMNIPMLRGRWMPPRWSS